MKPSSERGVDDINGGVEVGPGLLERHRQAGGQSVILNFVLVNGGSDRGHDMHCRA